MLKQRIPLRTFHQWDDAQPGFVEADLVAQLFSRIKKRAGMSEKRVSPSALRDTFAVRYLQAGGRLETLRELPGLKDMAAVKRYQRMINQLSEHAKRKGFVTCVEDDA